MRAISLIQPMAWSIAYGGRDVLNMPRPPNFPPEEWISIHAGKGWDREAYEWLCRSALLLGIPLCPPSGQHHHGRIVAVCRVPGFFAPHAGHDPNQWFRNENGNFGWHLFDVARLPDPVECRGESGLFNIPEGVSDAVELSLARSRICRSCSKARPQRYGPMGCPLKEDPAMFDAGGCHGWRPR